MNRQREALAAHDCALAHDCARTGTGPRRTYYLGIKFKFKSKFSLEMERQRGALARGVMLAVVCLAGSAGNSGVEAQLVELDSGLVSWLLSYMPWKEFNYSAPFADQYCPHPQCLRCSEPFEWDPHPYQPCRSLVPPADTRTRNTSDTLRMEVASPHLPFHGLLLCFTAPQVNLTGDTVKVQRIKEGGKLYDTAGWVVHPSPTSSPFLMPHTGSSSDRILEEIEYGTLSDFLANDEYYASTFELERYDQFRTWAYTREIAARLLRTGDANCMLLSSKLWKRRTRYDLTLTFSGDANVNVSQVTYL
jgi:hypothetical protein